MTPERASASDLPAIRALLEALRLPAADVGGPQQIFFVTRDGAGIAGCVGLERCDEREVLLRSLAVRPDRQRGGLGSALHAVALEEARRCSADAVYLLTLSAAPFFERRGYARVERSQVPEAVAGTPEFRSLCPVTAVALRRALGRAEPRVG